MPFSFKQTKEDVIGYVHDRQELSNIFFNPFSLCIIILLIIIVTQFMFDNEYSSNPNYYIVLTRHSIINYISIVLLVIVHDILIKDKYRSKIQKLEEITETSIPVASNILYTAQ